MHFEARTLITGSIPFFGSASPGLAHPSPGDGQARLFHSAAIGALTASLCFGMPEAILIGPGCPDQSMHLPEENPAVITP